MHSSFMDFIDSSDIREYVKAIHFTPAEEAVLICQSVKTTVEEKIQALQYLADAYSEEEFQTESVGITWKRDGDGKVQFREAVLGIIKVWKEVLADRNNNDNVIYAVILQENEYIQDWLSKWKFFTSYELAYQFMVNQKREYLEDSSLKHVKTYGEIYRIITDDLNRCYMDEDRYCFDNEMRLVRIFPNLDRDLKGKDGIERDITNQCYAYVPLHPF